MRPLAITVCGCGPGGLAAALLLNRAGHRVRLYDQFESPRPLGSGLLLQPAGMAVLDELGLAVRMYALGQRIDRLFGRAAASDRIVLDVSYDALKGGAFGLAVHRGALFNVLFDAAKAQKISVEAGFRVAGIERDGTGRPILQGASGRREPPCDLIIDALGARSPITRGVFGPGGLRQLSYGALWATLPWPGAPFAEHALEQRYQGASVMVGVLPVGRRREGANEEGTFFWSIKPAEYADWRARGLAEWKERVLRLWPQTAVMLDGLHDPEQLILASYGQHTLQRPYAERVAMIGDAAHATSPQLGQGANMALIDALALTRALEHADDLGVALATYADLRRRHVRLYQAMSALFTPFYQSDSRILPLLRDRLFRPLSALPLAPRLIASLVAGQWGGPLSGLGSDHETGR